MNRPLIEVSSLSHIFPDGTKALDEVSLDIHNGSYFILAGPNGSGKTVFMRHLNGLVRPTAGEVFLNGISRNC